MTQPPVPLRARIIANPSAAGGRDWGDALRAAAGRLAEHGWTVSWRYTEQTDHARALAATAAGEGVDVVVVAGGDGTVNEAVNGLVDTATALAVLPAGTGNVLAAQLGLIGIPTSLHRADLVAAAEALCAARVHAVDTGFAEVAGGRGRHFCLWAGIGLDAAVAQVLEGEGRELKRRLGPAAWGAVGLREALVARGSPATVDCDGRRITGRLLLGVVANVRLYGGAIDLNPDAVLDDGRLDVALFMGRSVWSKVRHLESVMRGRRGPSREWCGLTGARIAVDAEVPLPVHLDAEPFGTTPVAISVRPRSLRLMIPPTAPAGLLAASAGS